MAIALVTAAEIFGEDTSLPSFRPCPRPARESTCPIHAVKRLGRAPKPQLGRLLAYIDAGGASNGGTEAVNGLMEPHRRIARGFRNRENYRLRCLLIAGGLTP